MNIIEAQTGVIINQNNITSIGQQEDSIIAYTLDNAKHYIYTASSEVELDSAMSFVKCCLKDNENVFMDKFNLF